MSFLSEERMVRWATAALWALIALCLCAPLAHADPPQVAQISEPAIDAPSLHPADVHMVALFSDVNEDEHVCSDWEIWTDEPSEPVWLVQCAKGPERVHIHLGDGAFVGSYSGRTQLEFDSEYELRVRFFDGGEEWSEWAEREFTTKSPDPEGGDAEVPWKVRPGYEVEKVATGFQLPVNIAMVPDPGPDSADPLFYVAELYGTIKVVRRDGAVGDYATGLLNFNPTGHFPGSGEKGLAGLAVDPASGDLFATLVYEDDSSTLDPRPHYPKVIRLHSNDEGLSSVGETTVLDMAGESQGPSHQISHVEVLPGGKLMVHIGDGFDAPDVARDLDSFRGKILRMDFSGEPLADNPFYDTSDGTTARDYVWAYGFRNPFGGALRLSDGEYFEVENGPSTDRLARVVRGTDYLWEGSNNTMTFGASYNWPWPYAPVNIEFVEPMSFGGSGFPATSLGNAFVTESGPTYASGPQGFGKRVVEFDLASDGTNLAGPIPLVEYTGTGKATAVGLAAGEDGLYFSDLYKDHGYSSPIDPGANVLRISYCGAPCLPASASGSDAGASQALSPRRRILRSFRLQKRRFSADRGSAFVYALSESCTVRIRIRSLGFGWEATLRAPGRPGLNRRSISGHVGRHELRPGPYLATIVVRDADRTRTASRKARFWVLPSDQ